MGSFQHIFNLLDSACTGERLKQGKEKKIKKKSLKGGEPVEFLYMTK